MKEIKLTKGQVALVDEEDYENINKHKWFALHTLGGYYGCRTVYINKIRKDLLIHRVIMNTPDNMVVDHIDHNGLNCQKNNMRNCTHRQNQMNRIGKGKSKYIGVSIIQNGKRRGEIIAQIHVDGKHIYLGCFKTEEDAARVRDIASKIYFGEYANLNFK